VNARKGFSLVELLMVVAIIGILMSMYLGTLSKAQRKARQVVAVEGMRQKNVAAMAGQPDRPHPPTDTDDEERFRETCRMAFREDVGDEIYITRLLLEVNDDAEFRAYWHTLINPDASGPLTYDGENLVVHDEDGRAFALLPLDAYDPRPGDPARGWEFLSTHLGDMNAGTVGVNVMFWDGHVEYVRYPGPFPVTATVAELSRRFIEERR